ncbi:DUF1848 domain-containing protein [candidate division KSB1 bacterium]|nr:DUF1848 domain-containing protein [candidate division KSB1 bacterium]
MIISASRRTDIPRYFGDWLINRIRAGYCRVPNPFNPKQVAQVNLTPDAVTAIVFWTRYPDSLMRHLDLLDEMGYCYYFLYTLNDYTRQLEPHRPSFKEAVDCFQTLGDRLSAGRMVWRYDPIFFTDTMDAHYHIQNFRRIAAALTGCCKTVIISFLTEYRKTMQNLSRLKIPYRGNDLPDFEREQFLTSIADIAADHGLQATICADERDFSPLGIHPGRCIDDRLLEKECSLKLSYKKDTSQRKACHCMLSKDIGVYHTCPTGCVYCYANASPLKAAANLKKHEEKGVAMVETDQT